jgi:hypothetical protein
MTTKLTLSLDSKVIEQAKRYSKQKGISLSKIIESHLRSVASKRKRPKKGSATDLIGIAGKIPKDSDYTHVLFQALIEKHLK